MSPQDIADLIPDDNTPDNVIQEVVVPDGDILMEAGYFRNLVRGILTLTARENNIDIKDPKILAAMKQNRDIAKMLGFTTIYERSLRDIMMATRKYIDDRDTIKKIEELLQAAITTGRPIIEAAASAAGEAFVRHMAQGKETPEVVAPETEKKDVIKGMFDKPMETIAASFHRIGYAHLMSEAIPSSQGIPPGRADAPPQALTPAPKDQTQIPILKAQPSQWSCPYCHMRFKSRTGGNCPSCKQELKKVEDEDWSYWPRDSAKRLPEILSKALPILP